MNPEVLRDAVDEVLACPACEGTLTVEGEVASLKCADCDATYAITDGIPILLPSGPSSQEDELSFRDSLASQHAESEPGEILEMAARHHCIPLMQREAASFRSKFAATDLILDVGIGFGWHWLDQGPGAKIIGIDASLGNLKLARHLLGEQQSVILVCADAAGLPIRRHVIAGVWSVQVFQHFPDDVMRKVHAELDRVLRDKFIGEIYNLNPALLHRMVYRLLGRRLHLRGRLGEMELNRLSTREWEMVWREFREGSPRISSNYSELFFHPDFRLWPRRYPIKLERVLTKYLPWLAALFARQAQVRLDSRALG